MKVCNNKMKKINMKIKIKNIYNKIFTRDYFTDISSIFEMKEFYLY